MRGHFNPELFNPRLFNPGLFNHELSNPRPGVEMSEVEKSGVEKFMVEKSRVEKSEVERSGVEMSFNCFKVIKHVKKKHFPKYEFKCFYCKESYEDKKYLRLHIKCSHPEKLKAVLDKMNTDPAEMGILKCEEVEPVPSGDLLLTGAPPGIQTLHRP